MDVKGLPPLLAFTWSLKASGNCHSSSGRPVRVGAILPRKRGKAGPYGRVEGWLDGAHPGQYWANAKKPTTCRKLLKRLSFQW
jgi:hypothetical protein